MEDPNNIDKKVIKVLQSADLLFGAGGDKDLESLLYAEYLPVGAGLLQHDFSYYHNRPQSSFEGLEKLGFQPMYEDVAKYYNSCARFWIRESP